jgi:hypothetical protein
VTKVTSTIFVSRYAERLNALSLTRAEGFEQGTVRVRFTPHSCLEQAKERGLSVVLGALAPRPCLIDIVTAKLKSMLNPTRALGPESLSQQHEHAEGGPKWRRGFALRPAQVSRPGRYVRQSQLTENLGDNRDVETERFHFHVVGTGNGYALMLLAEVVLAVKELDDRDGRLDRDRLTGQFGLGEPDSARTLDRHSPGLLDEESVKVVPGCEAWVECADRPLLRGEAAVELVPRLAAHPDHFGEFSLLFISQTIFWFMNDDTDELLWWDEAHDTREECLELFGINQHVRDLGELFAGHSVGNFFAAVLDHQGVDKDRLP